MPQRSSVLVAEAAESQISVRRNAAFFNNFQHNRPHSRARRDELIKTFGIRPDINYSGMLKFWRGPICSPDVLQDREEEICFQRRHERY